MDDRTFLVDNYMVVCQEERVIITNPIKAEELVVSYDTFFELYNKISDYYETKEGI